MKVQEYITKEEFKIYKTLTSEHVLPAGSFVKPIQIQYLPAHIKADVRSWFNQEKEVHVYCHYGIIILPLDIIREA